MQKILYLLLVITMTACLPENGQKKAECASDKTYNTKTRTCDVSKIVLKLRPPVASLTAVSMIEDTAKTVELTYTDIDGDPISQCFITLYNAGIDDVPPTCSCAGGKCYATLTPDLNFFGTSDFTYAVTDSDGTSASKLVSVTVSAVNDAPIASAVVESFSTNEDTVYTGTLLAGTDVDAGDTALLQSQLYANASQGSVSINSLLGTFTYTPSLNLNGADSFTYRVYDPSGAFSNVKTVSITINAVDDTPVATNISRSTIEETAVSVSVPYTDVDTTLGVDTCAVATGTYYTISAACTCALGVCSVGLTPILNYNGVTTYAFSVTDGTLTSASATGTLTVTAVNDVPTISAAGPFAATENSASTSTVISLDEGGGTYEDSQSLTFTVASSNISLAPLANIQIYRDSNSNGVFDSGTDALIGTASSGTLALGDLTTNASASASNIFVKVTPVSYQSGTVNVTVTINDAQSTNNTAAGIYSFVFADTNDAPTISPFLSTVYSNEGGVTLVKQISVDEGAAAAGEDVQTLSVTVTSTSAAILPDSSISVYYDLDDDGLADTGEYVGVGGAVVALGDGALDAALHKVLLKLDAVGGVSGSSIINLLVTDSLGATGNSSFTYTVYPVGATHGGWKNILATGAKIDKGANTIAAGKITLEWNEFTVAGSGAFASTVNSGWRIYRRELGNDYNFSVPLNSSSIAPSVRAYDDTTATAGKVYFYLIHAIDSVNGIDIATEEIFSEVRVVMPPNNTAFIHRWMANQEVCKLMHQDAVIDPVENFRCPYEGPGAVLDGVTYYYDVGSDLLVDIGEVGCPYTAAPTCSGNGCIGVAAPTASVADGSVYYNRTNGKCYVESGAAVWTEIESAVSASSLLSNTAYLPPLVNVTQAKAKSLCETRSTTITGYGALPAYTLPSRKDQIAYSAWSEDTDDFDIATIESGLNLNSSSKCNTSSANGLTASYTDVAIPNSAALFTLPGTATSGIRSIYTSSISNANPLTPNCSSRYGVQDIVGNVSEWVVEQFDCTAGATCSSANGLASGRYSFTGYNLDNNTGPCVDSDANGSCDTFFSDFAFDDEVYEANYILSALGLPISLDGQALNSTWGAYEIGPTNGLTTGQLHDDGVEFAASASGAITAVATGGDYTSVEKAGRYYMKLYATTSKNALTGFRCLAPLDSATYTADALHPYSY